MCGQYYFTLVGCCCFFFGGCVSHDGMVLNAGNILASKTNSCQGGKAGLELFLPVVLLFYMEISFFYIGIFHHVNLPSKMGQFQELGYLTKGVLSVGTLPVELPSS